MLPALLLMELMLDYHQAPDQAWLDTFNNSVSIDQWKSKVLMNQLIGNPSFLHCTLQATVTDDGTTYNKVISDANGCFGSTGSGGKFEPLTWTCAQSSQPGTSKDNYYISVRFETLEDEILYIFECFAGWSSNRSQSYHNQSSWNIPDTFNSVNDSKKCQTWTAGSQEVFRRNHLLQHHVHGCKRSSKIRIHQDLFCNNYCRASQEHHQLQIRELRAQKSQWLLQLLMSWL